MAVCCRRHLKIYFLDLTHGDNGKFQLWYTLDSIILRILVLVGDTQSSAANRIVVDVIGHRVGRTALAVSPETCSSRNNPGRVDERPTVGNDLRHVREATISKVDCIWAGAGAAARGFVNSGLHASAP